jgi:hypothetical protein
MKRVRLGVAVLLWMFLCSAPDTGWAAVMDEAAAPGLPNIDWIVADAAPFGYAGDYAYMFQVEAQHGGPGVSLFSLGFDTVEVLAWGVLDSDDLDEATLYHPVHAPKVGPDAETFQYVNAPVSASRAPDHMAWTFTTALQPGFESATLYFIHPRSPSYAFGGYGLPTPAPDHASCLSCLSAACLALALMRSRDRRSV